MIDSVVSHFRGRIIQVTEALDVGDAVSNSVIHLKKTIERLGVDTEIYAGFIHPAVCEAAKDIASLYVEECDILIYHYAFLSERTLPIISALKCTKVLLYHNITPANYFEKHTKNYRYSLVSRRALPGLLNSVHYVVGVSQFNLDELMRLGFPAEKAFVLPLQVPMPDLVPSQIKKNPAVQKWLFVGRIAPNKRQDLVIKQFVEYQKRFGGNHCLYLIGHFEESDPYYLQLKALIRELHCEDKVFLTGKVSDAELQSYYVTADIFVCMSEHEGFCVPLIEAALYHLPVVAIAHAAITETIRGYPGLVKTPDALLEKIHLFLNQTTEKQKTIEKQSEWVLQFHPDHIAEQFIALLKKILPAEKTYQTVSVVICTYNRADLLDRCLDYLQYQTSQAFEVIVVNGPSDDHTDAIIKKYHASIKVARNPKRNLSVSRNIGIEMASGDIVAFIDDDALPYDDWIEKLLAAYNALPYPVVGVGGATFYAGSLAFQVQTNAVDGDSNVLENGDSQIVQQSNWYRYLIGTNASFKRDALFKIKGFDEQYDYYLDETDLCVRLQQNQMLLYFDPSIFVRHEFAQSVNRTNKYLYNWISISKNTVYFIQKFNPSRHPLKNDFALLKHLYHHRLKFFVRGLLKRELGIKSCWSYSMMIYRGIKQGFLDATQPRQLRQLQQSHASFRSFPTNTPYPLCLKTVKRLHVAIITDEFGHFTQNGGVGTMFYQLAAELLQMGHVVSVFIPGDSDTYFQRGRFTCYRIKSVQQFGAATNMAQFIEKLNWSYAVALKVNAVHQQQMIDLVESALWGLTSYALMQMNPSSIPIIVRLVTPFEIADAINDFAIDPLDRALLIAAEKYLIHHADKIVAISQSISSSIQERYQIAADHRWVHQPIGLAYWPQFDVNAGYAAMDMLDARLAKIPKSCFKVLFLGRLEKRKGIDIFLEAAQSCLSSNADICFIIAGRPPEKGIASLQTKNLEPYHDKLIFLGEVPLAHKDKLYAFCDVLVFPSRYESFGLVALEALVHGKPVIASNVSSMPEIIIDNVCGKLFAPEDVGSLVAEIHSLQSDKALYQKLSVGAKKRAYALSARRMAIESVKLYSEFIER